MSSPAEHPSRVSNLLKEIGPENSSERRLPQRALPLSSITGYGTRPTRPNSWWFPHNPHKRQSNFEAISRGTVSEPESRISSLPANPANTARVQRIRDMPLPQQLATGCSERNHLSIMGRSGRMGKGIRHLLRVRSMGPYCLNKAVCEKMRSPILNSPKNRSVRIFCYRL